MKKTWYNNHVAGMRHHTWGISAVGSAQHWQCWGQGFKSPMLHQEKSQVEIGAYPKGQFSRNTVYLERGVPYFCICGHKCSACQEN